MIRLVFLGRLADLAGTGERELAVHGPVSLAQLLTLLGDPLAAALGEPRVKLALNGVLAAREGLELAPGDELAFLPPVSGG